MRLGRPYACAGSAPVIRHTTLLTSVAAILLAVTSLPGARAQQIATNSIETLALTDPVPVDPLADRQCVAQRTSLLHSRRPHARQES